MLLRAVVLLAFVFAGCAPRVAAPAPEQLRAEAALATLLAVAAAPEADLAALAPLVAAQGSDAERRWRAPSDLALASEAGPVRALADRLGTLLRTVETGGRFGYVVEAFVAEPGPEGRWHVLRLRFDDPGRTEIEAAFLPVGEALLLGRFEG